MWTKKYIDDHSTYRVWLCSKDGYRHLAVARDGYVPEGGLVCTAVVPNGLLRSLDVILLAEQVRLADGGVFFVDAHGSWYTQEELAAKRLGVPESQIPWLGPPPRLAPR